MVEPTETDTERKVKVAAKSNGEVTQIRWDDTQMASSYANVVNATSSREEVTLFFGTNRTWNAAELDKVVVNLSNRIILNPHAAKRLLTLLAAVLAEYERRHGKIVIGPKPDRPPES